MNIKFKNLIRALNEEFFLTKNHFSNTVIQQEK